VFEISKSDCLNQIFWFSLLFSAVLGSGHVRKVRDGCVRTSIAGMPLIIATKKQNRSAETSIVGRIPACITDLNTASISISAIDQFILFSETKFGNRNAQQTPFSSQHLTCKSISFECSSTSCRKAREIEVGVRCLFLSRQFEFISSATYVNLIERTCFSFWLARRLFCFLFHQSHQIAIRITHKTYP
jgi:hypothetical protein